MSDAVFDVSISAAPRGGNGRTIKFTPERMEQIRNLVERGKTREEIAEMIGVTVNSLAVTCSKHGISLRRPKSNGNGVPVLRSVPVRAEPVSDTPVFSLRMRCGNRHHDIVLPINESLLVALAFAAEVRGKSISDLVASTVVDGIRKIMDVS